LLAKTTNRITLLDPYQCYLNQRFNDGHTDAADLYREIREQGYRGSPQTVRRYLQPFRHTGTTRQASTGRPTTRAAPGPRTYAPRPRRCRPATSPKPSRSRAHGCMYRPASNTPATASGSSAPLPTRPRRGWRERPTTLAMDLDDIDSRAKDPIRNRDGKSPASFDACRRRHQRRRKHMSTACAPVSRSQRRPEVLATCRPLSRSIPGRCCIRKVQCA